MIGRQTTSAGDWSGPGPGLPAAVRSAAIHAVGALNQVLHKSLPECADFASALLALDSGIALAEARLDCPSGVDPLDLARALTAAHRVRRRLTELQVERHDTASSRLRSTFALLENHSDSVAELVAAAPELVCRLGFDRAMISRIQHGVWYPELMFIMGGDVSWAEQITTAGNTRPAALKARMPEAELVSERKSILVTGVRFSVRPRSGLQAMINASGTRSYVAAPIVSGGHVVGMLHADCYSSRRDVDACDRDLLDAFALALRGALARCVLHEQVSATRARLNQLSAELRTASGALDTMPILRASRPPREGDPDSLMVRVGNPEATSDSLPPTLTARELEVLRLMAAGCTNTAIGERLMIAEGTVKKHVMHVLAKLNAANRSEAVSRWFRSGGDATVTQRRARRRRSGSLT